MSKTTIKKGTLFKFTAEPTMECEIVSMGNTIQFHVVGKTTIHDVNYKSFTYGVSNNLIEVIKNKNLFDIDDV